MNHYKELAEILHQRLEIIGNEKLRTGNPELQLEQLQKVGNDIERWKTMHLKDCPAQLAHFLVKYSLDKALFLLESDLISE